MTEAWVQLASTTLSSNSASLTFGSIPNEYRDLKIVVVAATTQNSNNIIQFNSDTDDNYLQIYMTGAGTSATSNSGLGPFVGLDSSAFTNTSINNTNHTVDILDYSATNKEKTVIVRANRAYSSPGAVDIIAGRWSNTSSPISSITLKPNQGFISWLAGSQFSLYGSNRL